MEKKGKIKSISQYGFKIDGSDEWYNMDNPKEFLRVGQVVSFDYEVQTFTNKEKKQVSKNVVFKYDILEDKTKDKEYRYKAWQLATNSFKFDKYITDEELHNLKKLKDYIEADLHGN